MTIIKIVLSVISVFWLLSCAETQELLKNNNPDKYTVAKDVLWASPDAFDLTMDIYTPTPGKDSYPVLLIFHGGGWLINNKGIMDQASKYLASNSEYVICNVDYRRQRRRTDHAGVSQNLYGQVAKCRAPGSILGA